MKKQFQLLKRATMVSLLLGVLVVGVAYALSPTLDGDDTGDWGINPTTCTIGAAGCSRIIDDPQDVLPAGNDYYDLHHVYMTNSSTNLYFRVDFWGNGTSIANSWDSTTSTTPQLSICLDIDNNDATGASVQPGTCDGDEVMDGVDYRIRVRSAASGQPPAPQIHTCIAGDDFCDNQTALGTIGYDSVQPAGDNDTITEVSILLSNIGITGSTCPDSGPEPCTIEIGLYYDNGVSPLDDSIPDTGFTTGQIGSNSPTVVSLTNLSVRNNTPFLVVGMIAVIALGGAFILLRSRKPTAE